MKTITKFASGTFLTLTVALVTPSSVNAQTGPSGSFTNAVSGGSNAVWDVSATLTNVDFSLTNNDDSTEVNIDYPVSVEQTGGGKLGGLGVATVSLVINGAPMTFPGSYKAKGAISSNHGAGHAMFSSTVTGLADIEGATRKVSAVDSVSVAFDNIGGAVTGTERKSASASGKGSISSHDVVTESLGSVFPGDGSWTLVLNLSTDSRNKVTGTGDITLNSGQTFHYTVHGAFNSKSNTSKITLSAFDAATKGSTLKVGMTGNTVASIKGKISGQSVDVSF
jgi:hypothetical protein